MAPLHVRLNFQPSASENQRTRAGQIVAGSARRDATGETEMTAAEKFRALISKDHRYDPEAYNFVYEALDFTLKNIVEGRTRKHQHVSGQELLEGVRRYGIEQFGCLARAVLHSWGIDRTDDFGEIVFNLVDHDLMGKQEGDSKAHFQGIYDFAEVFDLRPVFCYSRERDEWETSYVSATERRLPGSGRSDRIARR